MKFPKQFMSFAVHSASAERQTIGISHLIIAGWTGRDTAALEQHIRELEEVGVPRPSTTPIFYRVSANRLSSGSAIEVCGDKSSGEVEFVLVKFAGRLLVGVGSDHTDREVETYSVTVSKQMCDKPIAAHLWDFTDVKDHWDRLILRSWRVNAQGRFLYQEGPVAAMRSPQDLISRYTDGSDLPEGSVMFCGTLAARGGIQAAQRFEFQIEDPVLNRKIDHGYDVLSLPIIS